MNPLFLKLAHGHGTCHNHRNITRSPASFLSLDLGINSRLWKGISYALLTSKNLFSASWFQMPFGLVQQDSILVIPLKYSCIYLAFGCRNACSVFLLLWNGLQRSAIFRGITFLGWMQTGYLIFSLTCLLFVPETSRECMWFVVKGTESSPIPMWKMSTHFPFTAISQKKRNLIILQLISSSAALGWNKKWILSLWRRCSCHSHWTILRRN